MTEETPAALNPRDDPQIRELVELCRAGKLLEVQDWIAAGKPVNRPPRKTPRARFWAPLEWAIDSGFHSLVEVLLRAGATAVNGRWNNPLRQAIRAERLDLVQLLEKYGYRIADADVRSVLDSWDPKFIDYFVNNGADFESNNPIALSLFNEHRPTLGVVKRHEDRFPSFREQANIALRHHAHEGNKTWVASLLSIGADPLAVGPDKWDREDDGGISAIVLAAIRGHAEILRMKRMVPTVDHPEVESAARCILPSDGGIQLVEDWRKRGLKLERCDARKESGLIQDLTNSLWGALQWDGSPGRDSERCRGVIRAIHYVAREGCKWRPKHGRDIAWLRKKLLDLDPNYLVEFVFIMWRYNGCDISLARKLCDAPRVDEHLGGLSNRLSQIFGQWASGSDGR